MFGGSSLWLWSDRVLFTARAFAGEESCRPAMTLIVGFEGDVEVSSSEGTLVGKAFLVDQNSPRSIRCEHGIYSLILDPVHPISRCLRKTLLNGRMLIEVSDRVRQEGKALVERTIEANATCIEAFSDSQKLLDHCFPETVGIMPVDRRVAMVAAWLQLHCPVAVDLSQLAEFCGISSGRLAHLFTQEAGVSIRQYLLWVKMRKATDLMVKDLSLTEIAQTIGFADSAHLSRTFSKYFALKPSFLANKRLVMVRRCSS